MSRTTRGSLFHTIPMGCMRVFMTPSCNSVVIRFSRCEVALRAASSRSVLNWRIWLRVSTSSPTRSMSLSSSPTPTRIFASAAAEWRFRVFLPPSFFFPPVFSASPVSALRLSSPLSSASDCIVLLKRRGVAAARSFRVAGGRRDPAPPGRRADWLSTPAFNCAATRRRSVRSSKRSGPSSPLASMEASTLRVASTVSRMSDIRDGVSSRCRRATGSGGSRLDG